MPRDASCCTAKVAINAPSKATQTVDETDSTRPSWSPRTTANAAPELTPKMPGSASALRVCPCIKVPAIPRQSPIRTATTVRGNRRLRTITSGSEPVFAVSACHTAPGPSQREPSARLAANASTRTTTRARSAAARRTDRLAVGAAEHIWLGLPYF